MNERQQVAVHWCPACEEIATDPPCPGDARCDHRSPLWSARLGCYQYLVTVLQRLALGVEFGWQIRRIIGGVEFHNGRDELCQACRKTNGTGPLGRFTRVFKSYKRRPPHADVEALAQRAGLELLRQTDVLRYDCRLCHQVRAVLVEGRRAPIGRADRSLPWVNDPLTHPIARPCYPEKFPNARAVRRGLCPDCKRQERLTRLVLSSARGTIALGSAEIQ